MIPWIALCTFSLGTSPSTVLSTAGHTKKVEARHSTVKFQGKKGEWKETEAKQKWKLKSLGNK